MRYQVTFFFYGDTINIPVEAENKEQATAKAFDEYPAMRKKDVKVRVRELAQGEQALDDRAKLEFVEPQMGRPSTGRTHRIQVMVTGDLADWLETLRRTRGEKSISNVVFEMLEDIYKQGQKEMTFHPTLEQINAWADAMLEEATDDMAEKDIDITPIQLSKYFEENYGLPFTPVEAEQWLSGRDWYKNS
jgi:hypothetical protein